MAVRTVRIAEAARRGFVRRSRHGRRWRRWSVLAVSALDLSAHFLQAFLSIDHLHHVTRDAYADVSGEAHSVENWFFRGRVVLEITGSVASVAVRTAPTIARNIAERIPIEYSESISLADFSGSLRDVRR